MRSNKLLIMSLPGAGKTTLAQALLPRLNTDEIHANVHQDLGFTVDDRIEHARWLGWRGDRISQTGSYVIAGFICPTAETRTAFDDAFIVWVDRIQSRRFDVRVTPEGAPEFWGRAGVQQA